MLDDKTNSRTKMHVNEMNMLRWSDNVSTGDLINIGTSGIASRKLI